MAQSLNKALNAIINGKFNEGMVIHSVKMITGRMIYSIGKTALQQESNYPNSDYLNRRLFQSALEFQKKKTEMYCISQNNYSIYT